MPTISEHSKKDVFCSNFVRKERSRYERKGYGLIVAASIAISFFFGVPHIGAYIWPHLLKWQEENDLSYTTLMLLVAISLHNLIHLGGNTVYYIFYHFEIPFIERYKSNDLPWPWVEDPVKFRSLAKMSVLVLLFNSNVLPVAVYLLLDYFKLLEQHSMSTEDLPDSLTLALTITFFMLTEDFCFYWTHRLLHWRVIYPYIHKIHHSHSTTIGIAAEYAHPIEFILGNMLPTSLGPALLGPKVHMLTVFAWYIIRFGETLDGHCGYEFSWSPFRLIPFSGSAEYHDFHHAVNVGNFGSFFSIWDSVFGTNKAFYEAQKEREDGKKLKVL